MVVATGSAPQRIDAPNTDEPWYIGPSEAAKRSGLAQTTIHYALHAGQLRGFRVGRRWLIAVEDLHAWIRGEDKQAA